MGNQIDEMLDSMTPDELVALEGEVDKRAVDNVALSYFERGRELAREAVEHYEKTGEVLPILHLFKEAIEPAPEPTELDQILDKCSPEDLKAIEADLDTEVEAKHAEDTTAFYYNEGVKLAQACHKKEAARGGGAMGFLDVLKGAYSISAKKNPIGTALGTAAAGALVAPAIGRVFGGDRR